MGDGPEQQIEHDVSGDHPRLISRSLTPLFLPFFSRFELALKSQVPNDGLEEVLKILLRPLLDTEQTEGVNKKAKRVPLNNE